MGPGPVSNTAPATIPPDPPIGMDIWHSSARWPGCGQPWPNTDSAANARWYGTLAQISLSAGDLLECAAANAALAWSNWRTALDLTISTFPAALESDQGAQDFEVGWNGWSSAVSPNWANAAGAEARRIV